jgi:hypothetical protein
MREITFQRQLIEDLEKLHVLILRYAEGDRSVREERDWLEGSIQARFAIWKAIVRHKD